MRCAILTNMRIINAHLGEEVQIGDLFSIPGLGNARLLKVQEGPFSATITYEMPDGSTRRGPLTVRYTHPGFLLQKVGFIPT